MSHQSPPPSLIPTIDESDIFTYIAIPRVNVDRHSHSSDSSELSQHIALLRKRWRLIAGSGLITCCLAFAYCSLVSPSYTADTTIELRGHAPILSSIQSENLFGSDSRKIEYLKTTVAKLKLSGLADAVLGQDNLDRELQQYRDSHRSLFSPLSTLFKKLTPSISSATDVSGTSLPELFHHSPSAINQYLSLIDIEPVHETNLVHIKATTTSKHLSQKIANLHAIEFIEHLKRERQRAIQGNVRLLLAQSDALREKVAQAEEELSAYAAANKLLLAKNNDGNGLNHRHIESLAQMLADATGRRIKSESALSQAQQQREDTASFFDNQITQQLRASLKQSETEYASLGSQVTAAYPGMRELQAKILALKKAIREERKQGLESLKSQFSADYNTEQALRKQIEDEKSKAHDLAKRHIQYDVLSKEASSLRDLYQAVLKQAKEIEMSASVTTSNVFIADYASLPTSPTAPKTKLLMILATLVGLSTGIISAYVIESLSDKIVDAQDVHQALDLPILGSVPNFTLLEAQHPKLPPPDAQEEVISESISYPISAESDARQSSYTNHEAPESKEVDLITISAPHTAVAEALRTIRANVLLSSADYPPRVIMFASSIKGEGKTTILSNLGVTLAQANHKTLMIDGDLRMAGLTSLFGFTSDHGPGLSELLTAQLPLERVVHETTIKNLDLLPVGTQPPNPAELVGSASMKNLLAGLKERYDFILVDTPPVMEVADALLLSRMVDSVLFVVRSGVTPRASAREARQKLSRVKARIIGIILNSTDHTDEVQKLRGYGTNYSEG